MTIEYGGLGFYKDGKKKQVGRKKMFIPGGPGSRKSFMSIEDIPAPTNLEAQTDISDEERAEYADYEKQNPDASHPDDLRVLEEMADKDRYVNDRWGDDADPPKEGTLYDKQIEEAKNPYSQSFSNGRSPSLTKEEVLAASNPSADASDEEIIQNEFDGKAATGKAKALDSRAEMQESRDVRRRGFLSFFDLRKGRRNDDKSKKRGGRI